MGRERNYEVMRTVAMFFIIVYHCLTHGISDSYAFSTTKLFLLSNAVVLWDNSHIEETAGRL